MYYQAKAIVNMLRFSNDVYNTSIIFKFHDALLSLATAENRREFSELLMADAGAAALYTAPNREAFLHKPFELAVLRQCAPGTLGYAYAKMMDAAGLDPEFFRYMEVTDPASFFILRTRKTHDLHHVVTGFSTERSGEVGVQGYYLGQMGSAFPLSIVASAFISLMKQKPAEIDRALGCLVDGYQMGKNSVPYHGVRWEDHWNTPLGELRALLNISVNTATDITAAA